MPAFSRRARWWIRGLVAGLLLACAAVTGGLYALSRVPQWEQQVVARIEATTGLDVQLGSVMVGLGRRGPAVRFTDAIVYAPDGGGALVSAREGSITLAPLRSLLARRLEIGRVILVEPELHLMIFPDRHIELVGQDDIARRLPANRPPLRLDGLPRGHFEVRDARLSFVDLGADEARWSVTDVDLLFERRGQRVELDGSIDLPRRFGGDVRFAGTLNGDLAQPATLAWDGRVSADDVDLLEIGSLLPPGWTRPTGGRGTLHASASGTGALPATGALDFRFDDVRLPALPDGTLPAYDRVAGQASLTHRSGEWRVTADSLVAAPRDASRTPASIDAVVTLVDGTLTGGKVEVRALTVDDWWPLAELAPPGNARDALLALGARGRIERADLAFEVGDQALPRVTGVASVFDVGLAPTERYPGIAGLDLQVRADGDRGTVRISSPSLRLTWPAQWRDLIDLDRVEAGLEWQQRIDGLRLWLDGVDVRNANGTLTGKARVFLPASGDSPLVDASAALTNFDPTATWRYLPAGRLKPRTLMYLDKAFRGGRIPTATIELTGALRDPPYRGGPGRFHAIARAEDVTFDYATGWPWATGVNGSAEFSGAGMVIRADAATASGLRITDVVGQLDDWRDPVLALRIEGGGDAGDGVKYLLNSPLAPQLGSLLPRVAATGPIGGEAVLMLPLRRMTERRVTVRIGIDEVTAALNTVAAPVTALGGMLWFRDREIYAPSLTGQFLGGPLRVAVDTARAGGEALVTTVDARGTLTGAQLQPLLRFPDANPIFGSTDYRLLATLRRPAPRQPMRTSLSIDSTLGGLTAKLPAPLDKPTAAPRALRGELEFVAKDAFELAASMGDVRAIARFQKVATGWQLERGEARVAGGVPTLPDSPGLRLRGSVADVSLSDWLAFKPNWKARRRLYEWLTQIDVDAARAEALGYTFRDARVRVRPGERAWLVDAAGPDAVGKLEVPFELGGTLPLVGNFSRLTLGERANRGGAAPDPRRLPPMRLNAGEFVFGRYQLGTVAATLARDADGLRLTSFTAKHPAYTGTATGSWLANDTAQRGAITADIRATDVQGFLTAMGYGPIAKGNAGSGHVELRWPGPPDAGLLERASGTIRFELGEGQLLSVDPGAPGRLLGLMSVAYLPRRLALDFSDLTEDGLAFDSVGGDFVVTEGEAVTNNLTLRGPSAEIGVAGRTSFRKRDYDQTAVVTGELGASLGVAGALVGGPALGAAAYLFSQVFKEPLKGITRGYYRITGPWEAPVVQRVDAARARESQSEETVPAAGAPAANRG